jgi:hypothetical protein
LLFFGDRPCIRAARTTPRPSEVRRPYDGAAAAESLLLSTGVEADRDWMRAHVLPSVGKEQQVGGAAS